MSEFGVGPKILITPESGPPRSMRMMRGRLPLGLTVSSIVRLSSSMDIGGSEAIPCEIRVLHRSTFSPEGPVSGKEIPFENPSGSADLLFIIGLSPYLVGLPQATSPPSYDLDCL